MNICATILLPEDSLLISFDKTDIIHEDLIYKKEYAVSHPKFRKYHNHQIDESFCSLKLTPQEAKSILGREINFFRYTIEQELILYFQGIIEKITHKGDNIYFIYMQSYKKRLMNIRGDSYSKNCSLAWGGTACGINKESYKKEIQITNLGLDLSFSFIVTSSSGFQNPPAPYLIYQGDMIMITSLSLQNGFGRFLNNTIPVGETAFLYAGCNKEFSSCRDYYLNHENFSGFVF